MLKVCLSLFLFGQFPLVGTRAASRRGRCAVSDGRRWLCSGRGKFQQSPLERFQVQFGERLDGALRKCISHITKTPGFECVFILTYVDCCNLAQWLEMRSQLILRSSIWQVGNVQSPCCVHIVHGVVPLMSAIVVAFRRAYSARIICNIPNDILGRRACCMDILLHHLAGLLPHLYFARLPTWRVRSFISTRSLRLTIGCGNLVKRILSCGSTASLFPQVGQIRQVVIKSSI
mmetsp:Transcript_129155/g.257864  ORF Transcript_129155/g.257864 Transcript_129155/m.257864 type:complete len:232 (+) Transcript_129155:995-1690(+)